jgi:hypothetical protein
MNGADIGMIESRSRLRLALKARQGLGVFDDVIGQKLQGYKSVKGYVLSLVDNTHPAAPQLLDDAVVRDCLADQIEPPGSGAVASCGFVSERKQGRFYTKGLRGIVPG